MPTMFLILLILAVAPRLSAFRNSNAEEEQVGVLQVIDITEHKCGDGASCKDGAVCTKIDHPRHDRLILCLCPDAGQAYDVHSEKCVEERGWCNKASHCGGGDAVCCMGIWCNPFPLPQYCEASREECIKRGICAHGEGVVIE